MKGIRTTYTVFNASSHFGINWGGRQVLLGIPSGLGIPRFELSWAMDQLMLVSKLVKPMF